MPSPSITSGSVTWTVANTSASESNSVENTSHWMKPSVLQTQPQSTFRSVVSGQPLTTVKFTTTTLPASTTTQNQVMKNIVSQHSFVSKHPTTVVHTGSLQTNQGIVRIATSGQTVLQPHLKPVFEAVLQSPQNNRLGNPVTQTFLQTQSSSVNAVKSTQILTNATIPLAKSVSSSGGSILLPNQASIKTVPVVQTSTSRPPTSTSYQAQPLTLTFLNPQALTGLTESGPLLTNLLLKPASRINLEMDSSSSAETVQYVVHGGRLQNVYLPTQAGFQIPISGKLCVILIVHYVFTLNMLFLNILCVNQKIIIFFYLDRIKCYLFI